MGKNSTALLTTCRSKTGLAADLKIEWTTILGWVQAPNKLWARCQVCQASHQSLMVATFVVARYFITRNAAQTFIHLRWYCLFVCSDYDSLVSNRGGWGDIVPDPLLVLAWLDFGVQYHNPSILDQTSVYRYPSIIRSYFKEPTDDTIRHGATKN